MFWAKHLTQWGLVLLAVSALALAGCTSSSSKDKKAAAGPTDSKTGSSAADSVSNALGAALGGASGSANVLSSKGPIPSKLVNALKAKPGVGAIGRLGGGNAATSTTTVTLDFAGGPYACDTSGTVGVSGTAAYTLTLDDGVSSTGPYSYDENFSTATPLALTLTACSDGVWTLDGDVSYDVSEVIALDTPDLANWTFAYTYGDSFDASVTGVEAATSVEGSLEMTYALTGEMDGSIDSAGTFTYTVFNWSFDLTINGESYSCTLADPDPAVEPTCQ